MFVCQLLPFLLTGVLLLAGSDVFPADFTDIPLELRDDPAHKRVTAWNQRDMDPEEPIFRPQFQNRADMSPSNLRHIVADVIELYYTTATTQENILSPEYLKAINDFHRKILTEIPYYNDFCVIEQKRNSDLGQKPEETSIESCTQVQSLMHFMFAPQNRNEFINERSVQERLNVFKNNVTLRHEIAEFVPVYVDFDQEVVESNQMRAYFSVAWARYNESGKPPSTQQFASDYLGPYLWSASQNGIAIDDRTSLAVSFFNPHLYFDRLQYQVKSDLMLAIGSFCFIFCFLWMRTGSLFITIFGLFSVGSDFFTANLVYRYIFDFRYFGVFNVLSVFIILGIGVDDIFIFHDAWLITDVLGMKSIEDRIRISYKRSSLSMFTTSLTTTAAFTVNSFSPLLAISSFGLFSATLVVVNYISVITFFPCVLIANEKIVKPKIISVKTVLQCKVQWLCTCNTHVLDWLCRQYSKLVLRPGVQSSILVCMATLFGFLAYSATQLKPDNEEIRLYVRGHPLGKAVHERKVFYNPPQYTVNLDYVRVFFIWGIADLDKSDCHRTDWKQCRGKIVWDQNFDMNPYHAQRDLLNFCKNLKGMNEKEREELRVKEVGGVADVDCFIEDMDSYFESEFRQIIYTSREITGLPATDMKIEALMMNYPQLYDLAKVLTNKFFYRNFETASLFWLYDGYRFLSQVQKSLPRDAVRRFPLNITAEAIDNFKAAIQRQISGAPAHFKYGKYIGNSLSSSDLQRTLYKNLTLTYGTKLRYAAVVVNTTMTYMEEYATGLAVFDKWQQYFEDAKKTMAPSLQGGVFATPDRNEVTTGLHHWFKVQKELSASAIRGIVISLLIALPVLILSTDDIVIGSLATLVICCAAASVIGVIPLLGWRLGVLESLNLTLVVGLAIDYIVHVAEAYHMSLAVGRKNKVLDVVHNVGSSIVSGAISTLGSSLFMLFAQIAFFSQFGLFIFLTVGFSLIYSLGMFIVLLALVGPESGKYSPQKLFAKIARRGLQRLPTAETVEDKFEKSLCETESQYSCQTENTNAVNNNSVTSAVENVHNVEIEEGQTTDRGDATSFDHGNVQHPSLVIETSISSGDSPDELCPPDDEFGSGSSNRPLSAWKVKRRDGQNPRAVLPPLSKL